MTTVRGLKNKCPECGSTHLEHMTRVTGFFSKVESWNKGKVAELEDRRGTIDTNVQALKTKATFEK